MCIHVESPYTCDSLVHSRRLFSLRPWQSLWVQYRPWLPGQGERVPYTVTRQDQGPYRSFDYHLDQSLWSLYHLYLLTEIKNRNRGQLCGTLVRQFDCSTRLTVLYVFTLRVYIFDTKTPNGQYFWGLSFSIFEFSIFLSPEVKKRNL